MKKTIMLSIVALFMIGMVAAGAVSAFGMGKWGGNKDAVRDAIEARDFSAWKTAMTADLTEERFNQIVERQENRPEGSREGRMQMSGQHEEMEAAIAAGDFDAWKALMESSGRKHPIELTEENFEKFVEMHNAMQEGDTDTAASLREELGMPANGKGIGGEGMRGFGKGIHDGSGEGKGNCGGSCGECPYTTE